MDIHLNITLRLAQSLLYILGDTGNIKEEVFKVRVPPGTTIREVLQSQGINPLLVPMIVCRKKRVSSDTVLREDAVLTLHGPLSGG